METWWFLWHNQTTRGNVVRYVIKRAVAKV
jgi:hypothetical protein